MTILITGARGAVGQSVLAGLIDAGIPAADLRAASSDPQHAAVPVGVTTVAARLTDTAALTAALDGVDQVFLYAPLSDAGPVTTALRNSSVKHVVVLSAAAIDEPEGGVLGTANRAAEGAVADTGVTMTALRPGAFTTNALGWADAIRASRTVSTPYPDSHTLPIHPDDVADAAVAVLTGQADRGEAITLTGPQSLSFRDQVGILAQVVGLKLDLIELTPEEGRARMTGMPGPVADTLVALWAAADGRPRPVHDVTRITGRPARTFGQWVRENKSVFTS